MKMSSGARSWLITAVIVVICLTSIPFCGGGSPATGTSVSGTSSQQQEEKKSKTQEDGAEDFSIEAPQYSKSERDAIKVAERVAVWFGGYPSASGDDLAPVVEEHLDHLEPVVTPELYRYIDKLLSEGRMWSLQHFDTKVRPGSSLEVSKTGNKEVLVTVSKTLVSNGERESVPTDAAYQISLVKDDGEWKASKIANAGG